MEALKISINCDLDYHVCKVFFFFFLAPERKLTLLVKSLRDE